MVIYESISKQGRCYLDENSELNAAYSFNGKKYYMYDFATCKYGFEQAQAYIDEKEVSEKFHIVELNINQNMLRKGTMFSGGYTIVCLPTRVANKHI